MGLNPMGWAVLVTGLVLGQVAMLPGCTGESEELPTDPPGSPSPSVPVDADGDGVDSDEDCDDANPAIRPGVEEVCDGLDNNCDGEVDQWGPEDPVTTAPTWYFDGDLDGYGREEGATKTCEGPEGTVTLGGDCADQDPAIHPGAEDVCGDQIDNNCDGTVDETLITGYPDVDGDGYGDTGAASVNCTLWTGYVETPGDCDDQRPDIYPGAYEQCDTGVDEDCDGREVHCGIEGLMTVADAAAKVVGTQTADSVGRVAAGDYDADGYDDILTGASGYGIESPSDDSGYNGAAYLMLGTLFGDTTVAQADLTILGTYDQGRLGAGYSLAGDLNADGFDDVALSQRHNSGWTDYHEVLLYFAPTLGFLDGTQADATIVSEDPEKFGHQVSTGGDINGDGFDDLVVTEPRNDTYIPYGGAVYVFHGPLTGDLLSSEADCIIYGETGNEFGAGALTTAGDLNADGYDDIVVGVPTDSTNGCSTGKVYLFYGPVSGTFSAWKADATFTGDIVGMALGNHLASDGDINGDGFDDLVMGGSYDGSCYADQVPGTAYVWYGPVYGDQPVTGADATLTGESIGDQAGAGLALADFDQDGTSDLAIAAVAKTVNREQEGVIYLLHHPISGDIALRDSDTVIEGDFPGGTLGRSLAVGDINGDGYPDLVAGAPGSGETQSDPGRFYLFLGGPSETEQ